MNNAELTALLNESRNEARLAKLMANIARRASTLFTDGYTTRPTVQTENVAAFQVISPDGKRYSVKVSHTPAAPGSFFGDKCSCPCFTEVNTCKHLQACRLMLAEEAALDAQAAQEAEYHNESLDCPACYCYRN